MSNKIVVPENIKQAALDAEGETLLAPRGKKLL